MMHSQTNIRLTVYIAIHNLHTEVAGLYLNTLKCDNGFLLYLLSVIVYCHLSNLGCTA